MSRGLLNRLREQHAGTMRAANMARAQAFRAGTVLRVGVQDCVSPHQLLPGFAAAQAHHDGLGLRFREESMRGLLGALDDGELELAVLCSPQGLPRHLRRQPLFTQDYGLAVGPRHPLAAAGRAMLAQLHGEKYCRYTGCEFANAIDMRLQAAQVRPQVAIESAHAGWIASSVRAGHGVAFMARAAARAAGLAFVEMMDCPIAAQVWAVVRAERQQPAALRGLLASLAHVDWQGTDPAGAFPGGGRHAVNDTSYELRAI
jgi:DNA-binding transcriptional LysR family regulator